jgi:pyruvate dehydrogenase E1 component alpha subunit
MPLTPIEFEHEYAYLQVLDAEGNLDEELVPDLSDERLLEMHRAMLLARRLDERMLRLQRQGSIGTFAPVSGQEASQVGAAAAIGEEDWLVPAFRETAAHLWRGGSMSRLLVFNAGFNEGAAVPESARDLPIAVPVASQLPHAVGLAYASAYREEGSVVLTFFGDGATSEGDFHEAMNFAAVLELPVVFVCQNNGWAISVPRERQTRSRTLVQKAAAYGMPGQQVDGNDVLAVYRACEEAAARARDGKGPTLVECLTYRISVHSTADDPSRYREDSEVEAWRERDPIERLQGLLARRDLLTEEDVAELESAIAEEIQSAWDDAKARIETLGGPDEMFEHVYAELPPHLEAQRGEAQRGEARTAAEAGSADA